MAIHTHKGHHWNIFHILWHFLQKKTLHYKHKPTWHLCLYHNKGKVQQNSKFLFRQQQILESICLWYDAVEDTPRLLSVCLQLLSQRSCSAGAGPAPSPVPQWPLWPGHSVCAGGCWSAGRPLQAAIHRDEKLFTGWSTVQFPYRHTNNLTVTNTLQNYGNDNQFGAGNLQYSPLITQPIYAWVRPVLCQCH